MTSLQIIPNIRVCFIESTELTALFRTAGSVSCCCRLSTASTDVNGRVSNSSSSLGPVSRPPTRCFSIRWHAVTFCCRSWTSPRRARNCPTVTLLVTVDHCWPDRIVRGVCRKIKPVNALFSNQHDIVLFGLSPKQDMHKLRTKQNQGLLVFTSMSWC